MRERIWKQRERQWPAVLALVVLWGIVCFVLIDLGLILYAQATWGK